MIRSTISISRMLSVAIYIAAMAVATSAATVNIADQVEAFSAEEPARLARVSVKPIQAVHSIAPAEVDMYLAIRSSVSAHSFLAAQCAKLSYAKSHGLDTSEAKAAIDFGLNVSVSNKTARVRSKRIQERKK